MSHLLSFVGGFVLFMFVCFCLFNFSPQRSSGTDLGVLLISHLKEKKTPVSDQWLGEPNFPLG